MVFRKILNELSGVDMGYATKVETDSGDTSDETSDASSSAMPVPTTGMPSSSISDSINFNSSENYF